MSRSQRPASIALGYVEKSISSVTTTVQAGYNACGYTGLSSSAVAAITFPVTNVNIFTSFPDALKSIADSMTYTPPAIAATKGTGLTVTFSGFGRRRELLCARDRYNHNGLNAGSDLVSNPHRFRNRRHDDSCYRGQPERHLLRHHGCPHRDS